MSVLVARIEKAARLSLEALRAEGLRFRLGRQSFAGAHSIGPGVRVQVTDGGQLRVATGSAISANVLLQSRGRLLVGPGAFIGQGSVIVAREEITIGRDALIAEYVTIRDQDHVFGGPLPTARNGFSTAPVRIGDNVWLGAKVTILKGVSIGHNVVVGANSVVTSDLPDNVVAVGTPARVVREF